MIAADLAGYAITGSRPVWPLLVLVGLLLVVVTGLVVAQLTDPDRTRRAEERRALIAGIATADAERADTPPGDAPADRPEPTPADDPPGGPA